MIRVEGELLTSAEAAVIRTWRKLENPSQAKVAKALQLDPSTVSLHSRKPHVSNALRRVEQRDLDKATGTQGAIIKALERCQRLLDDMTDAELSRNIETLLGSTKVLMELAEKQQGLIEVGVFRSPKDAGRHDRWKAHFLRTVYRFGAGQQLLGFDVSNEQHAAKWKLRHPNI